MPRSYWKLHLDSSKEVNARKVFNQCLKAFDRPALETSLSEYSKGGYMATAEFSHSEKLSWPEIVLEVIEFGQKIGNGWLVLGDIKEESNAVLNKGASSNVSVAGLLWAEWHVSNEIQA